MDLQEQEKGSLRSANRYKNKSNNYLESDIDKLIKNSDIKLEEYKNKMHQQQINYYRKKIKELRNNLLCVQLSNLDLQFLGIQCKNRTKSYQSLYSYNKNQIQHEKQPIDMEYNSKINLVGNREIVEIKKIIKAKEKRIDQILQNEKNQQIEQIEDIKQQLTILKFKLHKLEQSNLIIRDPKGQSSKIENNGHKNIHQKQIIRLKQLLEIEKQKNNKLQMQKNSLLNQVKYTRQEFGRVEKQVEVLRNIIQDNGYSQKNLDVYRDKCLLQDQVIQNQREQIKFLTQSLHLPNSDHQQQLLKYGLKNKQTNAFVKMRATDHPSDYLWKATEYLSQQVNESKSQGLETVFNKILNDKGVNK